ncbi:hypothetical protein F5879DRAFT_391940 [Lentinula edodes]|nr:hypothetical protein F5879DRAFT_391940 [Lentinula edodes]
MIAGIPTISFIISGFCFYILIYNSMTDNIQVYVLLNKESCLSDLKLLEFLKAQDLDLDVKIVSDSLDPGTSLIRGDLSIKDAIALNQTEVESRCVVLIPSTAQDFLDVIPFIDKKAYWPNNIIAIDQSISLLLRCESFPQNATIAAPTSGTGDWEPQMKERIVNRTLQRDGEQEMNSHSPINVDILLSTVLDCI